MTDKFTLWSYNYFHLTNGRPEIILNSIWSPGDHDIEEDDVFTSKNDFSGHKLRVGNIPLGTAYIARRMTDEEGATPTQHWTDRWGMEWLMMQFVKEALNFTVEYFNPVGDQWGSIEAETGGWTGLYGGVDSGEYDLGTTFIVNHAWIQCVDPALTYAQNGYLTYATPLPRPLTNVFGILAPFRLSVWICVLISIPAGAAAFLSLSKLEARVSGFRYMTWENLKESTWYCFGTLMWESITRDSNMATAKALGLRSASCIKARKKLANLFLFVKGA